MMIQTAAQKAGRQVVVVPATYGYLSALGFALPWRRKQNIRWFQDQYSLAFSQYPNADFYFVGHSNGTYILGYSLARILSMRFERIYLAGSVLPRKFDWMTRFYTGQIKDLRNDRACRDWPVAILCSGLRGLYPRDVGTGGFDGFDNGVPLVQELFYYDGGHGKALERANLPNVIDYILTGRSLPTRTQLAPYAPSGGFGMLSRLMPYLSPLLLLLLLILYVLLGFFLAHFLPTWGVVVLMILIPYFLWAIGESF